ncbi:MAG: hypothetical protein EZS28_025771 [Streblomastix strix]|uniref:Uncharacterized protein n=1 Tax=Streblomastix strix TaxID=222440 RepID=A0A5J4V881_9EUKA|nr:MAG: hypothetical protein EZS28_025771 [Streblomastix strix]
MKIFLELGVDLTADRGKKHIDPFFSDASEYKFGPIRTYAAKSSLEYQFKPNVKQFPIEVKQNSRDVEIETELGRKIRAASPPSREAALEKMMGQHLAVNDSRNGIPCRSPGDKSYQSIEYCPNFYQLEGGYPSRVINYSRSVRIGSNNQELEIKIMAASLLQKNYLKEESLKRKEDALQRDKDEVTELESWKFDRERKEQLKRQQELEKERVLTAEASDGKADIKKKTKK